MTTGALLGTVSSINRYPVKSLQGEAVRTSAVLLDGLVHDRAIALADPASGRILTAKTVPELLWGQGHVDDGAVTITLPNGDVVDTADPGARAALSTWLDRPVVLVAPDPDQTRSYGMTFDPPDDTAEVYDIPAPVGSLHDLAPLHVLTTASLAAVDSARPDLDWDVRRYRPNVLLDVEGADFVEDTWVGSTIVVGDVHIAVQQATVRCALPLRAQPGDIERSVDLYRALDELHANHLGVYCAVAQPGTFSVGDEVRLLA